MKYRIIADSCCDLTDEIKREMNIDIVPLTLRLGHREYVDNQELDVSQYVKDMNSYSEAPKTSCPSPMDFISKYKEDGSIFVVTLSSRLSGAYQSAVIAKDMFVDETEQKFIHVFDSVSASAGETLICRKIHELAESGLKEIEIVEKVTKYISEMKTFFLLESLEHLAKAGRLNRIIAKIATFLEIKAIMGGTEEGTIKLVEKVRGYKSAFARFIETIGKEGTQFEDKILAIAHCNCFERAENLKAEIEKNYNFKEIIVVGMSGLSSTYADDGGLVIAF